MIAATPTGAEGGGFAADLVPLIAVALLVWLLVGLWRRARPVMHGWRAEVAEARRISTRAAAWDDTRREAQRG